MYNDGMTNTQNIITVRWQDEDETGDVETAGWGYWVEGGSSGALDDADDLLGHLRHEGIEVGEVGPYAEVGPIHINVMDDHNMAADLASIFGGNNVSWAQA
jgi:hypothetical protein